MTTADLAHYKARERDPIKSSYRGLDVYGMGPPSSGGTTVGRGAQHPRGLLARSAPTATQALHRFLEASRYAFADRTAYLADPAFFNVPLEGLLSDSFAAERRALIDRHGGEEPGRRGRPVRQPGRHRAGRGQLGVDRARAVDDAPRDVADRKGNVVSYTFTIESTGGNGVVVPGLRVPAQQRADGLQLRRHDVTTANRAEGGKRPRSSMAPTIVERDGKPYLAIGSPGGSTITRHRAADARQPDRPPGAAAERDRAPRVVAAQHGATRRPSGRSSTRRRAATSSASTGTRRSSRPTTPTRSAPRRRSARRPRSSSAASGR